VQILDVENHQVLPVYVHSKICIIDDVWAAVGGDNFNTRSWTYDSELTAAVLDAEGTRASRPTPPDWVTGCAGSPELRLAMLREHLDRDEDEGLIDPSSAADAFRKSAAGLDAWHEGGRRGLRPPGRLRTHVTGVEDGLPPGIAGSPRRSTGHSSTRTAAQGDATAAHLLIRDPAVARCAGPRAGAAARPEQTG
jgi:hypothetical protein